MVLSSFVEISIDVRTCAHSKDISTSNILAFKELKVGSTRPVSSHAQVIPVYQNVTVHITTHEQNNGEK